MASSQGGFKETLQPLNYNRSHSIYIPVAMGGKKSNKVHQPLTPPTLLLSPRQCFLFTPEPNRTLCYQIKIINNNKSRHELGLFVTGRESGDDTSIKATP